MANEVIGLEIDVNASDVKKSVGEIRQEIILAKKELKVFSETFGTVSPQAVKAAENLEKLNGKLKEATKSSKELAGSGGDIRTQIRAATLEVVAMQEKFGATSKEAVNAAKKVANLRDALGDAKGLADSFNPDRKFDAFSKSISGVLGGFSALQGGMALFGAQSENVQKTLLKVQAAMALSEGINSVLAAKDSFIALAAVIKTNVIAAFATLKTALITTGIGALVVGLGILISKLIDFTDHTKDAADAQDKLKKATEELNKQVTNEIDTLDQQNALIIKKAKLRGESEETLNKAELLRIQQRIDKRRREIDAAEKAGLDTTELTKQQIADNFAFDNLVIDQKQKTKDALNKIDKKGDSDAERQRKEAQKKLLAEIRANKEELDAVKNEIRNDLTTNGLSPEQVETLALSQEFTRRINILLKSNQDTLAARVAFYEGLKAIKEKYEVKKEGDDGLTQEERDFNAKKDGLAAQIELDNDFTNNVQNNSETRKRIAELEKEHQLLMFGAVANGLTAVSGILGEQTAAGKAFAIAASLINTYTAITGQLKAFAGLPIPGYAIAQAIATGLVGFAQVKKIASVKVPGKGGSGGGGSIGAGSLSSPPSVAGAGAQANSTLIDANSVNNLANQAQRIFVVESDISNSQGRIQRIKRAAIFG